MDAKFIPNHIHFLSDPDLPYLEIRHSIYKGCSFSKHMHDTLSVGAILSGKGDVFIQNANHEIRKGDVIVIPPGVIHSCNPNSASKWEYLMAHIQEDWLTGSLPDFTDILRKSALTKPILRKESVFHSFLDFYESLQTAPEKLEKEERMIRMLALVFSHFGDSNDRGASTDPKPYFIEEMKHFLSENLDQKVSLEQLSKLTKVSPFYLLRSFSRHVGIPPHAYLLQVRINLARKLIREGGSLVDVALGTGFFDQSHFTKAFKRSVGLTPRKYLISQAGCRSL